MANTYYQIHIQIIFAVKNRACLIDKDWKEELQKYITGIIERKGHKSLIVNGVEDHIRAFVGLNPVMAISDLVRDIKNNSSKFINEKGYLRNKFAWQEGFGAFSYSHSHIERVYNYILNQEEHHRHKTFREEYLEFLKKFRVQYDAKYLFNWDELLK